MIQSGTPCPYNGKIGKEALKEWKKYGKLSLIMKDTQQI